MNIKCQLYLLFSISLVLTFFSNPTLAAQCAVYKINVSSSLNIRSSPNGSIVGSAYNNQVYTYTGRTSGSWRQIWYDGYRRWAHKNYMTYQNHSDCRTISSTTWLNVRTGPSTGYTRVGSMPHGSVVPVVGSSGTWKKIYFKGALRYAYTGDYLIDHWKTSPLERYQNFWNRSDVQAYNNCYAFGTNKALHRNYAFNRDYKSGSSNSDYWPHPGGQARLYNNCSELTSDLSSDGIWKLSNCSNSCPNGYWKISGLLMRNQGSGYSCTGGSSGAGYHIMKQLSSGYWLHKNGSLQAGYAKDANGSLIRNDPANYNLSFCSQAAFNNSGVAKLSSVILSSCGCYCTNERDNIY